MIGAAQFAKMKPTAYLINTARGGLIDTRRAGRRAAAGPTRRGGPRRARSRAAGSLAAPYNDPRVIVTPHAAFVSEESLANLRLRVARQVAARLTGGVPENVVNGVR